MSSELQRSGNIPELGVLVDSVVSCLGGYKSSEAPDEQLMQLYSARQRRRLNRGLRRKQHSLLKRLRKAKKEAPPMEKPEVVKTHLRDMIILPEMVGSMVGVYNGKTFNQVEIKPEMIGHYLGEFSITYKPVKHGRPGIGATHSSRFIPLK
nr:PREDICTED: 40S ribosomal protein S15 [Struthio camelus australis]